MKSIVILSGGYSAEREISLITGKEIEKELIKLGKDTINLDPKDYDSYNNLINNILDIEPEIVFLALHGAEGEDGRIQAVLELNKIPFTGSGFRASALAMDKILSSAIISNLEIPVPKQVILTRCTQSKIENACQIGFPSVIKPNDSGSSFGISIVTQESDLNRAIEEAFKYSDRVICEQFISGRELTVTILGDQVLPVVEIIPKDGWYDYKNKYTSGNTIYQVPAQLADNEVKLVQDYAIRAYKHFGCEVYGRVDFRYDGKDFYFLEINTLPGMTALSLTPMAAKEAGISFGKLLETILDLSLKN